MNGKLWDQERIDAFCLAWTRGDPISRIRQEFRLSAYAIGRKVAKYGLTPRISPIKRIYDPQPRSAQRVRAGVSTLPPLPSQLEPS